MHGTMNMKYFKCFWVFCLALTAFEGKFLAKRRKGYKEKANENAF